MGRVLLRPKLTSAYFLSLLFLTSSTILFSMENPDDTNVSAYTSFGKKEENEDQDWQTYIKPDDDTYLRYMNAQSEKSTIKKEPVEDKLPEWLVESCLKNMPMLLKGIYTYLKSPNVDDPAKRVPSFHRFLLLGKPGTSKTTTAEAIAQSLDYKKKIIKGSSLLGAYRGHTALNIRTLFEDLKKSRSKKMIIINEFHKLFENHLNKHTDQAENAGMFWEYIDDIERHNPNIIFVGTANRAHNLPQEIKSRFRGQFITMPLLDQNRLVEAFKTIVKHDPSIKLDVDDEVIKKWNFDLQGYSFRDVKLSIDTAKMFAYADNGNNNCDDSLLLKEKYFDCVLKHFNDPDKVIYFDKPEETDEERQERHHNEVLERQDVHFVQQQLIQLNTASNLETGYCYSHGRVSKTYQFISESAQGIICNNFSDEQLKVYKKVMSKTRERQEREEQEDIKRRNAETKKDNDGCCIQ